MEDRFKFRAWDKATKKYIYVVEQGIKFWSTAGNLRVMTLAEVEASDRYVLEQCTGLKDENGKLIYEGDIVDVNPPDEWSVFDKYNHSEVFGKKTVIEDHGAFLLDNSDAEDNYCLYWAIKNVSVKIIGNIHENAKKAK